MEVLLIFKTDLHKIQTSEILFWIRMWTWCLTVVSADKKLDTITANLFTNNGGHNINISNILFSTPADETSFKISPLWSGMNDTCIWASNYLVWKSSMVVQAIRKFLKILVFKQIIKVIKLKRILKSYSFQKFHISLLHILKSCKIMFLKVYRVSIVFGFKCNNKVYRHFH